MEYFDSVFVINLDRRPDRWAEAQAELRLCGLKAERFPGIVPPPEWAATAVVGCTASHRALWRHVASGAAGDRVLIFEDDFMHLTRSMLLQAGFQEGSDVLRIFDSCPGETFPERFDAMLPCIPTAWDLLYLGGSYEAEARGRFSERIIRNRGMHCLHAYGLHRHFAERFTTYLDGEVPPPRLVGGAFDSMIADQAKKPDVFSYTTTPRLFIQRPTTASDANPQPEGFPWSMTDPGHEKAVDAAEWGEEYRFRYPLSGGGIILDAGAFHGVYASWCRERWPRCRVISFEPASAFFKDAQDRHKSDVAVEVHNYGLGAKTRPVPFVVRGDSTSAFLPLDGEVETVTIRDIAEVWEELKLDHVELLKLNIEGGEYEVLPRLIETGLVKRIRFLQIQFHWYGGIVEPDASQARIREALAKTHVEEFRVGPHGAWTWESWALR